MSSISIHSQGTGQVVRSITFTILSLVKDSMTLPTISAMAGYVDYRLAVLEDDLVVAQITKSILSFLGHKDRLSVLALDQFSLILDIAIQSGFNDQAAFKRTFHQFVGVGPGRRRRYYMTNHFRP